MSSGYFLNICERFNFNLIIIYHYSFGKPLFYSQGHILELKYYEIIHQNLTEKDH
jgi:hypothetical protein